jgi:hypothetical protein
VSNSSGFQFFGQVDIDARTQAMTVTLKDLHGKAFVRKNLDAQTCDKEADLGIGETMS